MRDEQHRCAGKERIEVLQEERGVVSVDALGWFVCDDEAGLPGRGHGHHHALRHAAGELEGIAAQHASGIVKPHAPQQGLHCGFSLRARYSVAGQRIVHLASHRQRRIEKVCAALRNQNMAAAEQRAALPPRQGQQLLPFPADAAFRAAVFRQKAEDRQRSHGLSAAGRADDSQALPGSDAKIQPAHNCAFAAAGKPCADAQVFDFQAVHIASLPFPFGQKKAWRSPAGEPMPFVQHPFRQLLWFSTRFYAGVLVRRDGFLPATIIKVYRSAAPLSRKEQNRPDERNGSAHRVFIPLSADAAPPAPGTYSSRSRRPAHTRSAATGTGIPTAPGSRDGSAPCRTPRRRGYTTNQRG